MRIAFGYNISWLSDEATVAIQHRSQFVENVHQRRSHNI